MSEPLLETVGLKKIYHTDGSTVVALDGIDLTIEEGDTLGVVGVSGSGKSTLLHVLGTLDRPSEGEVHYRGENIFARRDVGLAQFRNTHLGFVFQFHYLLPEFSALENVMMPGMINGMDMKEIKEKALDILERVGLSKRMAHRPGELSGGEQQRVAIARACLLRPKMILADEPTGNLDHSTGSSILDLFFKMNEEDGITIVLVTHNEEIIKSLKRNIRLFDGKIVYEN